MLAIEPRSAQGAALAGLRELHIAREALVKDRAAAGFNPGLKQKYAKHIDAGKPAKAAITAILGKIAVLANALLKARRK